MHRIDSRTASTTVPFDEVMSCTGRVMVVGDSSPGLAHRAVHRLHEIEQRWSRFIPTSDICRLNLAGGVPVEVSPDTATLVRHLADAHVLTDGAFDPTLLPRLVELGYGSSRTRPERRTVLPAPTNPAGSTVHVDATQCVIALPPGLTLDPGGLGKGLAADLVVDELITAGAAGCLVEIGGDLRVAGTAPHGFAWTIDVVGTDEAPVLLADGGVATSSSEGRTWTQAEHQHHHLLDPTTGRPTDTGVTRCTVVAASAAVAEALTKVAFVRGLNEGVGFYADRDVAARVVTSDATVVTTPGWRALQGVDR